MGKEHKVETLPARDFKSNKYLFFLFIFVCLLVIFYIHIQVIPVILATV